MPDAVPVAKGGKGAKGGGHRAPASSGGGSRRHAVERYSTSYTSIALVPDSQRHEKTFFMYVNIYINKYVPMCWLRTMFLKVYDISNSKTFI